MMIKNMMIMKEYCRYIHHHISWFIIYVLKMMMMMLFNCFCFAYESLYYDDDDDDDTEEEDIPNITSLSLSHPRPALANRP